MRKKKTNDFTAGGLLLLLLLITAQFVLGSFVSDAPNRSAHDETFFVQVSGDIRSPGVYGFRDPPDLQRLIKRAGGLRAEIHDPMHENSARFPSGSKIDLRSDTGMLHIDRGEMQAAYKVTLGIPISLNGETAEGLTVVPGFGPGIAGTIVRERDKKGGFRRLDELLSIPGIGPNLLRKVSRYLAL